jgi:serine/threonine protein kinase
MAQLLGMDLDPMMGKGFWEFFIAGTFERQEAMTFASSGEPFSMSITFQNAYHPNPEMFSVDFRPASNSALSPMPLSGIPAYALSGRSSASSDLDGSGKLECRYYFAITRPQNKSFGSATGSQGSGGDVKLNLSKVFPTVFKDVRLGPLIGRGAYGRVYRGTWNGNIVAVKVITSNDPSLRSYETDTRQEGSGRGHRGIFEAALSAALSHPNVVHTYQYAVRKVKREAREGEARQVLSEVWLIAEFCNRGPLLTAIERGAFLTQPSAQYGQPNLIAVLQTLQEIAAAMQYLHSHDVVHGDLTGGNVLLTSSDKDARGFTAKVVDFGLSRVCSEDGLRTKTMGCAEYMPPELITGGLLTKSGDVYAFGVILWELYCGKRAWAGLKPNEVLEKVASHECLEFPAQTPRRLKLLGERCLQSSPKLRPRFSEILAEVNGILSDTMNILHQFLNATSSGK